MVSVKRQDFFLASNLVVALFVLARCDDEASLGSCSRDDLACETGLIDESLNVLQQDDPKLVEVIRKRLKPVPPSGTPYNFSSKNPDLKGQFDQAEIVSELFKDQKDGFFVEAGAYDGEIFSNSLYYEVVRGWKGLLVEPNPDALRDLMGKNRKAHVFGHCLSSKTTPEVVDFDAAGLFGGIINKNKKPADFELDQREVRNRPKDYKPKYPYDRRTIRVQCFPLYSILLALGNPTVDIFSLDIEGAEFKVLETIPWSKVNIRVLIIEINHAGEIFEGNRFQIRKMMKDNGYKLHTTTVIDDIYIKRKF